jgi:hypothetical protein
MRRAAGELIGILNKKNLRKEMKFMLSVLTVVIKIRQLKIKTYNDLLNQWRWEHHNVCLFIPIRRQSQISCNFNIVMVSKAHNLC